MAPEPSLNPSGIVAVAIALLGPLAGEWAVIVLSALAGSLWALSSARTPTRWGAAAMVFRLVFAAVVLTGSMAWLIERTYDWPAHQLLAPVAFFIGMLGDRFPALVDKLAAKFLPGAGT
jgi:hypothetical protein